MEREKGQGNGRRGGDSLVPRLISSFYEKEPGYEAKEEKRGGRSML